MTRIGLAALACAAVVLVGAAGAFSATPKKLLGTVGPGFTITLKNAAGMPVKTLKPGRYLFVVTDKATIHDFHLKGPGVNKVITTVSFKGTKSVLLTLKKGRYTYVCDPHASGMRGSFTVA